MTLGLRSGRLLAALCALVALSACSEATTLAGPAVRPTPVDPRLTLLDPGAPGIIVICSSGGPAAFTATVSPAIGTLLGGGSFTVAEGTCVNAWTAAPNDARGATISVTQTSGAYINIEATAVPPIGLAYMNVNQAFKNVSWFTNFEHGGSATFFQNAPKKLVLCKEGPAGTYAFSVNAVGGTGNVYPSGASFSIAAGECKDVWTTNAPPPPIDPLVTVTELGAAPLDSIRKEQQDSAAVIVTGSRSVVSQVAYFHGGVVTFFNAFPPPPPPAATCVAITAVQGFAITPVSLVGTGGSGGPYTFAATGLPAGLSMSASGTISGTPTVSGTFTYTVTITDSSGRTSTFDCSVTVNAPPSASCVAITAVQGFAITPVTLVGTGGAGGPYTFAATGLPAGLSMSASGTISGTPTVSGTFTYTVTITDSSGRTSTFDCSVTVNAPPSASCVSITAVQGVAITSVSLVSTGGTGGPYTFSATGLPAGLSMSTSGTISGTATVNGTFTYSVTITDNAGRTSTFNCSLSVGPPPPPPQVLGIQGCTPGYWKTNPHADSWPATGYARVQLIGSVFTVPSSYTLNSTLLSNYSLLAGLNFQGGSTLSGKAEILLRAAIAGILNAAHANVAYELTSAQIISSVNSALASANGTTIIDLATRLDLMNNGRGGCPLN